METQGFAMLRFSENGTPFAEVGKFVNNSITVEGTTYQLSRNGRQSFALIGDYGPIVTAEWTGNWISRWSMTAEWQSSRFVVSPAIWWWRWEVQRDGTPAGTIRAGFAKFTAKLSPDLPLAVRAFLLYATFMAGPGAGRYRDTNHHS